MSESNQHEAIDMDGSGRREAERRAIAAILDVETDLMYASAVANISCIASEATEDELRTAHLLLADIIDRVRMRLFNSWQAAHLRSKA